MYRCVLEKDNRSHFTKPTLFISTKSFQTHEEPRFIITLTAQLYSISITSCRSTFRPAGHSLLPISNLARRELSRVTHARRGRMANIPKSYIREGTTVGGSTRWNVRCYDRNTRQTFTLGTFATRSLAERAFKAGQARLNKGLSPKGQKNVSPSKDRRVESSCEGGEERSRGNTASGAQRRKTPENENAEARLGAAAAQKSPRASTKRASNGKQARGSASKTKHPTNRSTARVDPGGGALIAPRAASSSMTKRKRRASEDVVAAPDADGPRRTKRRVDENKKRGHKHFSAVDDQARQQGLGQAPSKPTCRTSNDGGEAFFAAGSNPCAVSMVESRPILDRCRSPPAAVPTARRLVFRPSSLPLARRACKLYRFLQTNLRSCG